MRGEHKTATHNPANTSYVHKNVLDTDSGLGSMAKAARDKSEKEKENPKPDLEQGAVSLTGFVRLAGPCLRVPASDSNRAEPSLVPVPMSASQREQLNSSLGSIRFETLSCGSTSLLEDLEPAITCGALKEMRNTRRSNQGQ